MFELSSAKASNLVTSKISSFGKGLRQPADRPYFNHCASCHGEMGFHVNRPSLALSAPWAKSWSFADGIDQDHTAQNMQSDLDLSPPLIKSDICGTIICGTLWILYTVVQRGQF